jgi:hypothetical protein
VTPGRGGPGVTAATEGAAIVRDQKTRQGRTRRRQSRVQSSYLALMFLFSAALFLIGMVIVLIISLAL